MKCSQCGADNAEGMKFCGMCGKAVTSDRTVSPGEVRNRYCVGCGRTMSWDVNVCQYCGFDYRQPRKDETKDYLVVGAVLTLMAGVFSIVFTSLIISTMGEMETVSIGMAAVVYSCAFMGVLGGMLGLVRKMFPVAVLGAACSIMGPAFFFGIPGLVLIAKSAKQFDEAKRGPK